MRGVSVSLSSGFSTGLLFLLIGCTSGRGPGEPSAQTLQPGDHTITLEFGGRVRRYLVRIPFSVPPGTLPPVLVAFHGGGGNPEQFRETAGLDAVADREGILVVYPAGSARVGDGLLTWNAGPGCCGYARDQDIDDVQFTLTLLDDLYERHVFDPNRVFLTGHSNGSMMAYRITAEAPARIAGAAGVAGTMQLPSVRPENPVPILHIHSEDDPRAFYFGGTRDDRVHPPVSEMLKLWGEMNGCGPSPVEVEARAGTSGSQDEGHYAKLLAWDCGLAPLEHWRLTGVGHSWPGHRISPAWEWVVGPDTELISAAEEVWSFISRLGA